MGFSGEYKREIVVNLEREFDADAFDAIDVSDSRSPLLEDGPILSFE